MKMTYTALMLGVIVTLTANGEYKLLVCLFARWFSVWFLSNFRGFVFRPVLNVCLFTSLLSLSALS